MAVNNQFSIAVHMMTCLDFYSSKAICSETLAASVNANPSFVRRILAKLSRAKLIKTTAGKGGHCILGRAPQDISLYDIFKAIDGPDAFAIHTYPTQRGCAVSRSIKPVLEKILAKTQRAMEQSLKTVSLADTVAEIRP